MKVKIVSEVVMKRQMMMTWESWENYTVVACGGRSDAVVPFCSERGPNGHFSALYFTTKTG